MAWAALKHFEPEHGALWKIRKSGLLNFLKLFEPSNFGWGFIPILACDSHSIFMISEVTANENRWKRELTGFFHHFLLQDAC